MKVRTQLTVCLAEAKPKKKKAAKTAKKKRRSTGGRPVGLKPSLSFGNFVVHDSDLNRGIKEAWKAAYPRLKALEQAGELDNMKAAAELRRAYMEHFWRPYKTGTSEMAASQNWVGDSSVHWLAKQAISAFPQLEKIVQTGVTGYKFIGSTGKDWV